MKQIIQSFRDGEMWLAEVPVPQCKRTGALIQTRCSFVSAGTERMLVDFARKNIIGKAISMPDQVKKVIRKIKSEGLITTLQKVQAKLDQPIPLGYSAAGIVEEVGTGMSGIAVGDRVACGGAGFANHAEYNYVPKNLIVKIPDGVSFEDASCTTVGAIALQGIRQCDLRLGENVCVIGLGLLGLIAVQMLKASGCRVIGFDLNPGRCQMAEDLGADLAINTNLLDAAMDFSDGYGVDTVLITAATKSDEPVTVAGEISRQKGKVVVTGLVGMDIPREQYYKKELDFKLSLSYGPGRYDPEYEDAGHDYPYGYVRWTEQRNMKAFLDLVASGKVTPGKLITHRYGIDDALDAYELLQGKIDEPYMGIVLNYAEKVPGNFKRRIDNAPLGIAIPGSPCIGMIGCGNFTKGVLLPQIKKAGYPLAGLCTATGMNCGETSKKEKFAFATTDQNDIINDSRINCVFITTRHDTHAPIVCDCLKKQKNVFVEKPLAATREQLDELCAVREKYNTGLVMTGFNRRFSPHAVIIKDYFSRRNAPMLINYRINAGFIPRNSWLQDQETGGGRIIGEVCHFIDFSSYLTGSNVIEVQATAVESGNAAMVDQDNVAIALKYKNGSVANIVYVAMGSSDLAKEYCEIFADGSNAVMNDFRTTICSGKLGSRKISGKQDKGFSQELEAFFQAVINGKDSPVPWHSLVNTTRVTFAIHEAMANKKTVTI